MDAIALERVWRVTLYGFCGLVLIFLAAPLLAIVPLSFNAHRSFTYPIQEVSLRWYVEFFESNAWMLSLENSLIIGLSVTVLATVMGTLAAVGLTLSRFAFKGLLIGLLVSPMMVPHIILGVGMFFLYAWMGIVNSLPGMILAHTTVATPFVVMTVTASLANFNPNLLKAAASLGARPLTVFFRVMAPNILPGMLAGAVLAFVASFDELIIAILLSGSETRTLPRQMWSGVREEISPVITAVATVLISFAVVMMILMEWLRRRSDKLRGRAGSASR